jgi:hypothetical protein
MLRAKRMFLSELREIVSRMTYAERNALRDANAFVGARDAQMYRLVAGFASETIATTEEEIETVGKIIRGWKIREASEVEADEEAREIARDWGDYGDEY